MEMYKFLLILGVISLASAFDYCNLCPNHIACRNNGSYSSLCPTDATLMTLTNASKEIVVSGHNTYRHILAGGNIAKYVSASKMMLVKWDSELADLAKLNVIQCQMKHDLCRATSRYPLAGQNLYLVSSYPAYRAIDTVLGDAVRKWFNEYLLANQTVIDNCCGGTGLQGIGHFLQIAQERVLAIGCAVIRYKSGRWFTSLVACNYSTGNILNKKVYISGPPGSACPIGRNSVYPNLCNW